MPDLPLVAFSTSTDDDCGCGEGRPLRAGDRAPFISDLSGKSNEMIAVIESAGAMDRASNGTLKYDWTRTMCVPAARAIVQQTFFKEGVRPAAAQFELSHSLAVSLTCCDTHLLSHSLLLLSHSLAVTLNSCLTHLLSHSLHLLSLPPWLSCSLAVSLSRSICRIAPDLALLSECETPLKVFSWHRSAQPALNSRLLSMFAISA